MKKKLAFFYTLSLILCTSGVFANGHKPVELSTKSDLAGEKPLGLPETDHYFEGVDFRTNTDIIIEQTDINPEKQATVSPAFEGKSLRTSHDYEWKNPSLNNLSVVDIKFIDNDIAYGIGQLGQILKSTDGGLTWQIIQTPFTNSLRGFDFKDGLMITIGNEGFIAITADEGASWSFPESGVNTDLRDITFGENGQVYIAGNSKTMLYSEDNGTTWQVNILPDNIIYNPHDRTNWNFQSIWVINDTIMMGTGLPGIPIQIVRSTDNGVTWEYKLPQGVAIPNFNIGAYLTDISFAADGLTGYASYWALGINGLAKTTDGGISWAKVESLDQFMAYPNPEVEYVSDVVYFRYSVAVSPDGQKIITGGSFGQIFASTDGGQSWSEIFGGPLFGHRDMRSTVFEGISISPDGQSWLCSGTRGLILESNDFGVASSEVVRNGKLKHRHFLDASFTPEGKGIVVGSLEVHKFSGTTSAYLTFYEGQYLTSSDGGHSWNETSGPPVENHEWNSVITQGDNKIWIGGVRYEYEYNEDDELIVIPHAVISFSNDGGENWDEQLAIAGRRITAMNKWNENYLYATTDGNIFLRSLTGQPWEQIDLPAIVSSNQPVGAIEVIAPEVLFLGGGRNSSGANGYILKTNNGGTDWSEVYTTGSLQGTINHISFVDGRFGYAGGQWGGLFNRKNMLYTSDYGETWQETYTSSGNYLQIYYIAMLDSVTAFSYGHNGFVAGITDGENLNLIEPEFASQTFQAGYFNGAGQLFAVGLNGTIVKYNSSSPPNSAPGKFACTFPIDEEVIFIPWDDEAFFTWEESVDPDNDQVSYVFILESLDGSHEFFRSEVLTQNEFVATTENFPSIPPMLYRWRVEAFDEHGLYSTSYPVVAFVDVDDYINDQNDIVSFSFFQEAFPSEIDNQNHTIQAHVIYGTDITNLSPDIEISYNATISPESGETLDFSDPVTYTVSAQNGDQQQWTVSVNIADPIDYITIKEYQSFEYSMIPASQFPELNFRTKILNEGHRDVSQVTLNITINEDQTLSTTPLSILPMGDEAILEFNPAFEFPDFSQYNIKYEIGIGEDNPNLIGHTAETSVELTDSVYALDSGAYTNSLGSNSSPVSIGNIYEVINNDHLTSVSIYWGANLPSLPLDFTISIYKVDMETLTNVQHIYTTGILQRLPDMALTLASYKIPDLNLEPGHYSVIVNQLSAVHIRVGFTQGGYFYIYDSNDGGNYQFVDDETFGFLMIRPNFGGLPLSDDATLSDLMVEGTTIDDFDPSVFDYSYTLAAGATQTPDITAVSEHQAAIINIIPATDVTSENQLDRTTIIIVTAEDGETTLEYSVEFIISTGVIEAEQSEIKIYPNPAREYLIIESPSQEGMILKVITLDGRIVGYQETAQAIYRLNINALPAGVYILSMEIDEKVHFEYFSIVK